MTAALHQPAISRRRPSRRAGFTLIEIILAVSIMAILLVAIQTAFFSALRLRAKTTESVESGMPTEEALQIIQHDLANLVVANNPSNGTFFGPLQTINQTNIQPGQIGPDFYISGGELDGMAPWGNTQKIDYLLASPTNGTGGPGRDLIRAITHNLLPINPPATPDEKQTILSGVSSVTFLYYDGTQWDQVWDTTQETNLPYAIKVQIQMAVPNGGSALTMNPPLEIVVPVDTLLNTNPITAIQ